MPNFNTPVIVKVPILSFIDNNYDVSDNINVNYRLSENQLADQIQERLENTFPNYIFVVEKSHDLEINAKFLDQFAIADIHECISDGLHYCSNHPFQWLVEV